MEKYNYYESVLKDVKQYIEDNADELQDYENREDLEEYLNETLWTEDAVTGNASGSYTFNTWEAEENICHNMELLSEALEEFGGQEANYKILESAESCDVTIRCYLLGNVISDVLDEFWVEPEER